MTIQPHCTPAQKTFHSLDELFLPKGFCADPSHSHYVDADNAIHFHVLQTEPDQDVFCPHCGSTDCARHGYETRTCQILPIAGQTAYVHIRQRRLRCKNPDCQAVTFIVPCDGFRIFQHRSDQLNMVILAISVFCSDTQAALICRSLGIQVEHDSIRRLLSHIHIQDNPDVEEIGVDDVCRKKGQTYCTAIYDAKDHHLMALLEGRDGKALEEWLKVHPKVKMIARDRASAYARAIEKILPDCIQVADRFHLFQNLMDRMKKIFKEELPESFYIQNGQILDKAPEKVPVMKDVTHTPEFKALDYDNSVPVDENGNEIHFINKSAVRNGTPQYKRQEQARIAKHAMICALRSDWQKEKTGNKKQDREIRRNLAAKYGICEVSAVKYLRMTKDETEEILQIKEYKKRQTPVNNYLNMIFKMLRDGIKPVVIYQYVLSKGYKGSSSSLKRHIDAIGDNNNLVKSRKSAWFTMDYPAGIIQIKRNEILKYMTIKDRKRMDKTEAAQYYDLIKEKYPVIRECERLWNEFHKTLMGDEPEKMDEFTERWKNDNETIDYSALSREADGFVQGLKKDIAPIKNAISFSLSSGFVEGGNCRYKSTKRIMFGRAGQNHLFHKTYAISIIMRQHKNPKDLLEKWLSEPERKVWPKKKRDAE